MLLTILKIIGIALLAILALVLLILLIVLLVPLRLNVKARYEEDIRARVHVSWLLRAVHVKLEWLKDHGLLRAKLLGLKTIMKKHLGDWGPQPEKALAESPVNAKMTEEAAAADQEKAAPEENSGSQEKPAEEAAAPAETASQTPPKGEEKAEGTETEASASSTQNGKEPGQEQGAQPAPGEAQEPSEDLPKLVQIDQKLAEIAEKLDEFQGYWYDEKNRKTVRLIGKQLKRIGKHLKPTRFQVEGELGFEDPGQTGKIMGLIYSLYPVYKEHIQIQGNYQEPVMRFRVEMKGRLRLGLFVSVGLRLLLNRNLRQWIKKLMHKDKNKEKTAAGADQEVMAA